MRVPWFIETEEAAAVFERMNELGRRCCPFLFVLDYRLREPRVMTASEIPPGIRFAVPGASTGVRRLGHVSGPRIRAVRPVPFERYRRGFELVQSAQREGYSYLANLTYPSDIDLEGDLDAVFDYARAPYRLKFGDRFVVFSPEPFVRIADSRIRTFPMKGTREVPPGDTREASGLEDFDNDSEDSGGSAGRSASGAGGELEREAITSLEADEKEAAEHATVVDLLRNDLGSVARTVRVPRYRYIDRITFPDRLLVAASSEIVGELPQDWRSNLGNIFRSLLPAGSVTGAPKGSTCRIIEQAEGYDRGFYTGVFGWFDGSSVESAVMIRFIEANGSSDRSSSGYRFKSGGGITIYSECELEYRELIRKVAIPFQAAQSNASGDNERRKERVPRNNTH